MSPSLPRAMFRSIAQLAFLGLAGCASAPLSFVQITEPGWTAVEIRSELGYEQAWQQVVDVIARRLEPEMISKDGGYVRTKWSYTWTGASLADYRVRAIIKFSPDHSHVSIRTDAQYGGAGERVPGTDTSLTSTLKTDLMGLVSRTTR